MAELSKEILIETENKPGIMAGITNAIKNSGINIRALCAWGVDEKGHFMIVTEDIEKAFETLKEAGYAAQEEEVVLIDLKNEVGTLNDIAQNLGDAGININYCYVSAVGDQCLAVLGTDDNAKVLEIL